MKGEPLRNKWKMDKHSKHHLYMFSGKNMEEAELVTQNTIELWSDVCGAVDCLLEAKQYEVKGTCANCKKSHIKGYYHPQMLGVRCKDCLVKWAMADVIREG